MCLAATSLAGAGAPSGAQTIPHQITYQQRGSEPDYGNKPDGHGKLLVLAGIVRAVRPDGSQVEWETSYRLDGSVDYRYRTLTLSNGIRLRGYETLGLMTSIKNPKLAGALARKALDPSKSCGASYDGSRSSQNMLISQETLFGYETYKILIDMKLARRTVWRAPALGCAELRDLFEKVDPQSGRVIAVGDRVATDIRAGEPDAALFEIPVGFRNVSPSELVAAQSKNCCNRELSDSQLSALASKDEEFRKFRFDP